MRSILSRSALLVVAAAFAISAVAPASAAVRGKRAVAPQPAAAAPATSADVTGLPIHPAWSAVPPAVYQQPNGCFTDEGYGRYTSCEQGGF
jgi:hypothetical protein